MLSTNLTSQIFRLDSSIKSIFESFIYDRQIKNLTPKTIKNYQSEMKLFLQWLNGDIEIESLTPDMLRRYFLELSTHRNKGGVYNSYRVIKAFLNFYDYEYEPDNYKNPIKKIKIPANNNPPLSEIPLDDIQKMIDSTKGLNKLRDICILKCLVDCGARGSEFIALNVEDIDLLTGSLIIKHGKGDKKRIVYLGEKSRKALRRYLKTRNNLSLQSPLWVNRDGGRLTFNGLREIINRLCKKANIPHKSLHSFRRCFALTLYRKNVDILTISSLLGHTSVLITKRYININDEDLRKKHAMNSPADGLI